MFEAENGKDMMTLALRLKTSNFSAGNLRNILFMIQKQPNRNPA